MFTLPRSLRLSSVLLVSAASLFSQSAGEFQQKSWGAKDGKPIFLYTLQSPSGMKVSITNYGGTVTSIEVKDRHGKSEDVVLGFDSLSGYTSPTNKSYFGALIGRYGNRLAHGQFTIDGHKYQVPTNDGPNSLHGGTVGYNARVWDGKNISTPGHPALQLHYLSLDGEMGFPGNLDVTVKYSLDGQALGINYTATTDKTTVLNLTNHSYFNLAGAGTKSVLEHRVMLAADRFTPVDATLIPTGVLQPVTGTPFDFHKSTAIGARINDANEQLKLGKGYDHNYVLNANGNLKQLAARVEEPSSGRILEVFTDQPGLQFYSGNFLDGTNKGVGGVYEHRSAFCMETQHFPDSPNQPKFPTALLKPGETFHKTTIYRFSAK